ncbi:hypothetical protein OKA04_04645 [Luteolibacter flavescens]|uniref:Uncharacterized protein n=1 Tax=Luteolibacter flavescens TaxID=1859460 RepID=A0ABT3FM07_9BACT|nr:hypothetical protein [Luteolibacter flavescens]MCW1884005.1 hypothetical protein [Luteolibacter flavescens]
MDLTILTELEAAHPRLLKRTTLQAGVSLAEDNFTKTAFDRAMVVLEQKGDIRIQAGEDVQRVAITAAGLNRLAETR